jgi:hypothetical protein
MERLGFNCTGEWIMKGARLTKFLWEKIESEGNSRDEMFRIHLYT